MSATDYSTQVLVDRALLSRINFLMHKKKHFKSKLLKMSRTMSAEDGAGNDDLVKLYTGFATYSESIAFYEFLGHSANELAYRGVSQHAQKCLRNLYSVNQLILTLTKELPHATAVRTWKTVIIFMVCSHKLEACVILAAQMLSARRRVFVEIQ